LQFEIENFLRQNPNADAPKLTVTKVKNKKGTDDIRVLIDFNGASQTVTILDDGTNIMQVGSATLKYSDFYNPTKLFSKVEKAINMKPDSWRSLPKSMTTPFRMATYEQMQKMNLATRTEYIKSIQDLLVTMEKMVPGEAPRAPASKDKKTSALEESILREINFFMSVIVGRAEADGSDGGGQACIAAGYRSTVGMDSQGRTVCKFPPHSRNCGGNSSKVMCNPVIFGTTASSDPRCVDMDKTATMKCKNETDVGPMAEEFTQQLNSAKKKEREAREADWEEARKGIEEEIKKLQEVCNSRFSIAEIQSDQAQTCVQLSARLARVQDYSCTNDQFKIAHREICEGANGGGVVGPTQPSCECTRQQPTQRPTTDLKSSCVVEREPEGPTPAGERVGRCIEAGDRRPAAVGGCGDDTNHNCSPGGDSGAGTSFTRPEKKESAWAKWKPWLIFGGIMLAGYFLMDWAWKDASRAAVDRLPQTPQPPVTVPPPPPFGGIDGG
jgi:hypothetical protein